MIAASFTLRSGRRWLPILAFLLIAQPAESLDLTGRITLVDAPPDATPVEALRVEIRSLSTARQFSAQVDPSGNFTLKDVGSGHYSLRLSMPSRIQVLKIGSRPLSPVDFEIGSGEQDSLTVILSLASSDVLVTARGIPKDSHAVAILAPADPMLSLQESCILNELSGGKTRFRYLPPGRYRLFVVDSRYQQDVAKFAPRRPDFLAVESLIVEAPASNQAEVTATYIDSQTVLNAIRDASQ